MELKVLGSSSSGNCYILENENEALIIEAGASVKEVKKALDFRLDKVKGILASHEHGDHSKYLKDFIKTGISVYSSAGTLDTLEITGHRTNRMQIGEQYTIGGYRVLAFDIKHDCAEPVGFLIHHGDMGTMLFLTDSYYSEYTFEGLSHILIEANYSSEILNQNVESGKVHPIQKKRVIRSHFEIENTIEFLEANDLREVNNIILIHLSDDNSNATQFKDRVQSATRKMVHVADKGLEIELNKDPF